MGSPHTPLAALKVDPNHRNPPWPPRGRGWHRCLQQQAATAPHLRWQRRCRPRLAPARTLVSGRACSAARPGASSRPAGAMPPPPALLCLGDSHTAGIQGTDWVGRLDDRMRGRLTVVRAGIGARQHSSALRTCCDVAQPPHAAVLCAYSRQASGASRPTPPLTPPPTRRPVGAPDWPAAAAAAQGAPRARRAGAARGHQRRASSAL